jgi:sugar phosphate isomerase/epimerase
MPHSNSSTLSRRGFLVGSLGVAGLHAWAAGQTRPATAPHGQLQRWQIGCYTRPWAQHDYRVALDAIAEAGFTYAGLMTTKSGLVISAATSVEEAQQVGDEAKKRGLRLASAYGGDIEAAQGLKPAVEALKRLIDNCAAAGVASLLMGGVTRERVYDTYYQAIAQCCDHAVDRRVEIVLKPHGGLNTTAFECRKAVEKVGHRAFRIWYDAGNILYYSHGQLDPVEQAGVLDGLVTGWCIKDYRHPRNVDVTPGTGQVKFAEVFARLRKGGFKGGPLLVETLARGEPAEKLAEARRARLFLEELTKGA